MANQENVPSNTNTKRRFATPFALPVAPKPSKEQDGDLAHAYAEFKRDLARDRDQWLKGTKPSHTIINILPETRIQTIAFRGLPRVTMAFEYQNLTWNLSLPNSSETVAVAQRFQQGCRLDIGPPVTQIDRHCFVTHFRFLE
jgi:hypothetical protein